jgi:hypothetical protein
MFGGRSSPGEHLGKGPGVLFQHLSVAKSALLDGQGVFRRVRMADAALQKAVLTCGKQFHWAPTSTTRNRASWQFEPGSSGWSSAGLVQYRHRRALKWGTSRGDGQRGHSLLQQRLAHHLARVAIAPEELAEHCAPILAEAALHEDWVGALGSEAEEEFQGFLDADERKLRSWLVEPAKRAQAMRLVRQEIRRRSE